MKNNVEKVAVIGAGTMGSGIAQVAALSGCEVVLNDVARESLDRAAVRIRASVEKGIAKGKTDPAAAERVESNLSYATSLETAAEGCDLVVEAVFEDADLKREILQRVSEVVTPSCILASNTSSLSITGLAAGLPQPARVVGMHFFNPVPVMALIEIVRGIETSEETAQRVRAISEAWGKQPIVVQDTPGFATSRLGVAIGLEAIRMLESGVARAEEIDRAMELGYRHPMGPLRLTDLVGLDVRLAIAEHLHREVGEQFRPPSLLRNLVRAGRLGKKTGHGFYEWEQDG